MKLGSLVGNALVALTVAKVVTELQDGGVIVSNINIRRKK